MAQAENQEFGQLFLFHLLLSSLDVVFNAVIIDDIRIAVIQCIAGTGVVVTGLSHAAGIDDAPIVSQFNAGPWPKFAKSHSFRRLFEN